MRYVGSTTKKHSHGPTYRANTATLHGRAMDSMSRGGGERGMHHTLPSNKYINLFRNDQVLGEMGYVGSTTKKHSHGPTYRAITATLHRRAVDSMPWIACRGVGGSVGCVTHCQQQVYQLISINNLV